MVLNRLTPILVAVHVLTIPTSATNVRASSVLQPYHFPSVLEYTVLTSGETLCCDNRRLIGTPLIVIARQSQKNHD